jgi:O-antigen/teichoic acid export membrane protein
MWRFFWATTGITFLIALGLEFLLPVLVQLFFGAAFAAVVPVTRVLLVGSVLLSSRRALAEVMKGAGDPAAGSIAELASFASLLPAFILLIPSFHLIGVGVAVGVSAAISLAVLFLLDFSHRGRIGSRRSQFDIESVPLEAVPGERL